MANGEFMPEYQWKRMYERDGSKDGLEKNNTGKPPGHAGLVPGRPRFTKG